MNLAFDVESSAQFWRQRYPAGRAPRPSVVAAPARCASTACDVEALMPPWVDASFLEPSSGVFHALNLCGKESRRRERISIHCWSAVLPRGSFYELSPHVFVESPAAMFLHAGAILSLSELVAFGDELCGLYSFDAREERGFRKRTQPLATRDDLEHMVMQTPRSKGRDLCLRALPHVVERSASPMETLDEMLMCLPYRYGGYCLAPPVMNQQIDLSDKAARIARRRKCYLDMGYKEFGLDVEHHGKHDHSDYGRRMSDRARVNALKEMGLEVIELTAEQVGDLYAFEFIVQRVARILGKRIRGEALGATPARLALRESLFRWNETSGRIR